MLFFTVVIITYTRVKLIFILQDNQFKAMVLIEEQDAKFTIENKDKIRSSIKYFSINQIFMTI